MIKPLIRNIFNLCGLDIMKKSKSPSYSFLGLRTLPIRTIIDVGANKGQFAKTVLDVFPNANIHCFEPLAEPFSELTLWAEKQKKGRIKTYNFALGEKEDVLEFLAHNEHSPSSSFLKTTSACENLYPFTQMQNPVKVKVTTLDNWFKNLPDSPNYEILLKLDVQGYEDRVIRGGQETFKKAKACILEINLDKLYENQATFKNISALLYELGYKYAGNLNQSYAIDGHVVFIDAVFVK